MPDEKPLTKSDLVAALKELGVATKADIQKTEERLKKHVTDVVVESNQAIIAGVNGLHAEVEELTERVDRYHPTH